MTRCAFYGGFRLIGLCIKRVVNQDFHLFGVCVLYSSVVFFCCCCCFLFVLFFCKYFAVFRIHY